MGNDHNDSSKQAAGEPPVIEAQPEHNDAFKVLEDLGRDLAAGAARVAETVPTEGVQKAAQKAAFLGHATAQVAGKAREVAHEVAHMGQRGREAVEQLEEHGVPVRRWWHNFVKAAGVTTDPLPTNKGPDVCVGPSFEPDPPPPGVKVTVSRSQAAPASPRKGSQEGLAPQPRKPAAPAPTIVVEDEPGVVSPSDPRRRP